MSCWGAICGCHAGGYCCLVCFSATSFRECHVPCWSAIRGCHRRMLLLEQTFLAHKLSNWCQIDFGILVLARFLVFFSGAWLVSVGVCFAGSRVEVRYMENTLICLISKTHCQQIVVFVFHVVQFTKRRSSKQV